jgi:hypothetical protein
MLWEWLRTPPICSVIQHASLRVATSFSSVAEGKHGHARAPSVIRFAWGSLLSFPWELHRRAPHPSVLVGTIIWLIIRLLPEAAQAETPRRLGFMLLLRVGRPLAPQNAPRDGLLMFFQQSKSRIPRTRCFDQNA